MATSPILVIQMQRLGDLVLTYPLLAWLAHLYPEHPLWVVAEERFFPELMELSPPAVYFPFSAGGKLRSQRFRLVVNLSHRPEALALAGCLDTEERIGAYRTESGSTFIDGRWQLYRASLVNNNRYNLFHWADMNTLDCVPPQRLRTTAWHPPAEKPATTSAHVGLFLGASEKDKHPEAPFWAALAGELLQAGHRPVLLGGEAEAALGEKTASLLGAPALNLTGRFSISSLCRFIAELDILVTPDTGPMHIAAWTGTPTLNLSIGPVNAWETGPFSPNHHVLRADLPCVGCWHCVQTNVVCKERLDPKRTAVLIHELTARKEAGVRHMDLPAQELLLTARDSRNLYLLRRTAGEEQPRHVTALFWQAFFGREFGVFTEEDVTAAWKAFASASPGNAEAFIKALLRLSRDISLYLRGSRAATITSPDFWASYPLPLRPLTSYLHLDLQNGLFHKPAFANALAMVERLMAFQTRA